MMCFLPTFGYHIVLVGDIKELLQRMLVVCFNYQHLDCLYTLLHFRFCGKSDVKDRQFFDHMQRAGHFNQQNREVNRKLSIPKWRLLREKYKNHLLSSFQKTNATQTSGSVLADRIEQVKKTKLEVEMIKIVYCFVDGHGNYLSNLVSWKKSLYTNHFINSLYLICEKDL